MSSESLAANGESIVSADVTALLVQSLISMSLQRHKVLFIASSLLNKYPSDNAGHDHVSEFLNVVSEIREGT